MGEKKGVIYILTNPSFPAFVKIGYSDSVERRLVELNRSECTPFAFRVYATYDVESRLSDKRVHDIIDKLNPDLRAIDTVDGKKRIREFYEMSAEDAFSILEAIAEINGREDSLHRWGLSEKEREEQEEAAEVEERQMERLAPFSFDKCNIAIGEEVVFTCRGNEHSGTVCKVASNKKVEYDGREWSLSELACYLAGVASAAGPRYFKYQGRWLNDIRREIEGRSPKRGAGVRDSWVIPCGAEYYDMEAAFAELGAIEWKQLTYVEPGDTVYVYVPQPVAALRYKCVVEEADLYGPVEIDDSKFYKGEHRDKAEVCRMRIRLVEDFGIQRYPMELLKKYGLNGAQSHRRIPAELEEFLESGE